MKLSVLVVGALLLGCAGTAFAMATEVAVPVALQWQEASRHIDQAPHAVPIREIDWRAGHPRGGYSIPERKPAQPWPAVEPDFRDMKLPRGIELPAHLKGPGPAHLKGPGPAHLRPSQDPEDDVVRCMAIGCEKG